MSGSVGKHTVSLCGKFGANYMPRIPCNHMGGQLLHVIKNC